MKNIFKVAMVAAGIFSFAQSQARTMPRDTITHKVGRAAKKVGNATAHTAVSGESAVVDKKYAGKCGPDGQTIYINKYSHYYYVNKRGHKVYLRRSQLKDKRM